MSLNVMSYFEVFVSWKPPPPRDFGQSSTLSLSLSRSLDLSLSLYIYIYIFTEISCPTPTPNNLEPLWLNVHCVFPASPHTYLQIQVYMHISEPGLECRRFVGNCMNHFKG